MKKDTMALLLFVTLGFGCSGQVGQPERSQLGDAAADTQTMKEAKAAAEEVVGVAGDCDAVKAAAPEALRKLDEIKGRARTGAGQTAIDSLRKQVTDTAGVCP
jgi:hypothetical protein